MSVRGNPILGMLRNIPARKKILHPKPLSRSERKTQRDLDAIFEADIKRKVEKWAKAAQAGRTQQTQEPSPTKRSVSTVDDDAQTFNRHKTAGKNGVTNGRGRKSANGGPTPPSKQHHTPTQHVKGANTDAGGMPRPPGSAHSGPTRTGAGFGGRPIRTMPPDGQRGNGTRLNAGLGMHTSGPTPPNSEHGSGTRASTGFDGHSSRPTPPNSIGYGMGGNANHNGTGPSVPPIYGTGPMDTPHAGYVPTRHGSTRPMPGTSGKRNKPIHTVDSRTHNALRHGNHGHECH